MKRFFPVLIIFTAIVFLNLPCKTNKRGGITDTKFASLTDGTIYKKIISFKNGDRAEIYLSGIDLDKGTYQIFDTKENIVERGEFIHGKFQRQYSQGDAERESIAGLVYFAVFIYLTILFFKNRQAIIDWYRITKRKYKF